MAIKAWITSILSGMVAMADPLGTVQIPTKSDEEAILSDWKAVGDDLRNAMQEMGRISTRG